MFRAFFLVLLAVFAAMVEPAVAQPRRGPDVQPLDRVLPQVRSRYPGTFYDADGPFTDEGGNPHYRLKWMTPEGRVMWLDTDARTGRVLGVEHGGARGGSRYNAPPPDAPPPDYFEGRPRGGAPGDNSYRGRDRWQHGPNGHDRDWGGGRGNWNGGGHGNWGGDHGGHGGDHHGHGH